jgi:hypothetical protein
MDKKFIIFKVLCKKQKTKTKQKQKQKNPKNKKKTTKYYLLKQLILPASLGSQAHNMCKEMQYKESCKNTVK